MEVQWYARGELGEYVRDIMDSFLDDMIDASTAIQSLQAIGMSAEEMMNLLNEEIEMQQATFH